MKKVLKNQRGVATIAVVLGLFMAVVGGTHIFDVVRGTNHLGETAQKIGTALKCDSDMPCLKCHSQEEVEKLQAQ